MTTPVELLERVKGRIKPLLLEDELLEAKLRKPCRPTRIQPGISRA
jgi:hypothetical protein